MKRLSVTRVSAALFAIVVLPGCEVTPDPADDQGPQITMTSIVRGSTEVFESSDPEAVVYEAPVCPNGTAILGTVHDVPGFPIEVLISGADRSGVKWLRLSADGGVLSAPDPASVRVYTRTVAGNEISVAEVYYPDDEPETPRAFSVTVNPEPGSGIVKLEGGARDYNDNVQYTLLINVGTLEDLCETFAP